MSYAYRNTYKKDGDSFIEDRGYPHSISRGDADFVALEAEFEFLPVGSTANHSMIGDGWDVVPGCPFLDAERAARVKQIDVQTSQAILAGFNYGFGGVSYHFSYDTFDQQNFADTANACLLLMQGVEGLPQTVTWNAYKDDQLVRLTLTAQEFLQLYTAGALAHKALQMEIGGQKKAALDTEAGAA